MIKKVSILLAGFLSAAFILPYIVMAAGGAFIVDQGGTGWQAFTANSILLGNGKNRLATTSAGTNGQSLFLFNQIPTWATASTSNGTVTSIATTFPIQGGPITSTGTLTFGGLSTSSPWTQGGLATAGANQNILFTTATGTVSVGSSALTLSATRSVVGGALSIDCATASAGQNGCLSSTDWSTFNNKGSGSVTSIVAGTGLNGGTITTAGTLSLVSYLATSTADTAGQVMYWSTTNGTPAKIASVATSTQTLSAGFSTTGTIGNLVGGTSGTLSQIEHRGFTYTGTTTSATGFSPILGTSTFPIESGYSEVWNSFKCYTDQGSAEVQFGYGTASTTMFNASTTNSTNIFTTNNTMTAGNKVQVTIGSEASSPTFLNCTWADTI